MYKQKNDYLDQSLESTTMDRPCPVCGGTEFEWGRLGGQTYYVPGQSMWRWRGYQYIRIRRCLQCNNLLQFADPGLTSKTNRTVFVIVVLVLIFVAMAGLLPVFLMAAK